jgi:hypothetical protein
MDQPGIIRNEMVRRINGLIYRFRSFLAHGQRTKMKPMHEIINTHKGEDIPQQYKVLLNKLTHDDWFGKVLVVAIIFVMVLNHKN